MTKGYERPEGAEGNQMSNGMGSMFSPNQIWGKARRCERAKSGVLGCPRAFLAEDHHGTNWGHPQMLYGNSRISRGCVDGRCWHMVGEALKCHESDDLLSHHHLYANRHRYESPPPHRGSIEETKAFICRKRGQRSGTGRDRSSQFQRTTTCTSLS